VGPLEFGYQGLPRDPETGLIYFRNRYYDPELGRFISADPKGYTDGPSMYAFEMDDPANGSDPMGLCLFGLIEGPCSRMADAVDNMVDSMAAKDAKNLPPVLREPNRIAGHVLAGVVTTPLRMGQSEGDAAGILQNPGQFHSADEAGNAMQRAMGGTFGDIMTLAPGAGLLRLAAARGVRAETAEGLAAAGEFRNAAIPPAAPEPAPAAPEIAGQVHPNVPVYPGKGKAQGVLELGDQQTPLTSGYAGPSASMPRGTPGMNNRIKSHVEAHAAATMRQQGAKQGTLYINKTPCPGPTGCGQMLPRMLPGGAKLRVVAPNGFDQSYTGLPDPPKPDVP
jgi:RHS repeat-associated protein